MQRFATSQPINALRLEGDNQRRLDQAEPAKALSYLESVANPSWAGVLRTAGLAPSDRFGHERGSNGIVRGNATETELRGALGAPRDRLEPSVRDIIRLEIGPAWRAIEYC